MFKYLKELNNQKKFKLNLFLSSIGEKLYSNKIIHLWTAHSVNPTFRHDYVAELRKAYLFYAPDTKKLFCFDFSHKFEERLLIWLELRQVSFVMSGFKH